MNEYLNKYHILPYKLVVNIIVMFLREVPFIIDKFKELKCLIKCKFALVAMHCCYVLLLS